MNTTPRKLTGCIAIFTLVAAALLLSASPAKATVLVQWNFGDTIGRFDPDGTPPVLTPEQIAAGLAPSTAASGISATSVGQHIISDPDLRMFTTSRAPGTGAMFSSRPWNNADQYIEFGLSASEPGTTLTITEVSFLSSATATTFGNWLLHSSVDEFTTLLASGPIQHSTTILFAETANILLVDEPTVTFRLSNSVTVPQPGHHWDIDNLTIVGSVIPEPRAAMLLGVGLAFLIFRFRKARA